MTRLRHSGDRETLKSVERRNFLGISAKYGFTAAVAAAGAGTLWSNEAAAQTAKEERDRERSAKHKMTVASAYAIGKTRGFPVMQLNIKENVQNTTNGKVYVKLAPAGQLGVGSELAKKVQGGTIQAAQHSISNFAPFAPAVDLINIPYWCGDNQQFVNLVTSKPWKEDVESKVEARGFKPLMYLVVDPRTAAKRKGLSGGPFKTPEDLKGIKFRVPGSKVLAQFYQLLGANPTPIAWGETPSAIRQGVADALDPCAEGLWLVGFGDILSSITFNRPVPDSQVYSMNLDWFKSLDATTQEQIDYAAEITSHQNYAQVPASRAFSQASLRKDGVEFYSPTEAEMAQWREKSGHHLPEWDGFKKQFAGSLAKFDRLREAANTQGRYYVHDI